MADYVSRRRFLTVVSVTSAAGLAGCTTARDSQPTAPNSKTTVAETASEETADETVVHRHESADDDGFDEETRRKAREVGAEVQRSVVKLSFDGGRGGGTGWLLDEGRIVTNAHIARESATLQVETFDGETGTADRVGYHDDMTPDIALLETDLDVPSLPAGSADDLEPGQPMLIVGHPARVGEWVVSLGPFREYRERIDWLLTDAPTNQGNSGSPLVTLDGEAVGCVSGATYPNGRPETVSRSEEVLEEFPEPEELATATPMATIRKWVDEWA